MCIRDRKGGVFQPGETVFPLAGGEFVENAVDSPDEGVVGVPGQLLFDQPLSGAPHHARVVDHPGVPL